MQKYVVALRRNCRNHCRFIVKQARKVRWSFCAEMEVLVTEHGTVLLKELVKLVVVSSRAY